MAGQWPEIGFTLEQFTTAGKIAPLKPAFGIRRSSPCASRPQSSTRFSQACLSQCQLASSALSQHAAARRRNFCTSVSGTVPGASIQHMHASCVKGYPPPRTQDSGRDVRTSRRTPAFRSKGHVGDKRQRDPGGRCGHGTKHSATSDLLRS
jgi:hypothetical protein